MWTPKLNHNDECNHDLGDEAGHTYHNTHDIDRCLKSSTTNILWGVLADNVTVVVVEWQLGIDPESRGAHRHETVTSVKQPGAKQL